MIHFIKCRSPAKTGRKRQSVNYSPAFLKSCAVLIFMVQLTVSGATLTHRYIFTSNANDSVGTANGTLQGSAAISGGKVVLNGTSHAVSYVSLPGGLVNSLSAVTIEAWVTNSTSPDNVHLFSFSNGGWTGGGNYLRFNLHDQSNGRHFAEFTGGNGLYSTTPGLGGRNLHLVFVYDPVNNFEAFYTNGVLEVSRSSVVLTNLSKITDTVGAIGRSPWYNSGDNDLNGAIDEFRIWSGTLNPLEIAASYTSGPDTLSTNYGTVTNLTWSLNPQMAQGAVQSVPVMAFADGLTNAVNVSSYATYTSGDTSIITVSSQGSITAWGSGSTTVSASYGGQTNTQTIAVLSSATLLHRYTFASDASDSVGTANGTLQGSAVISGGKVVLNGTGHAVSYVSLPGGLASSLTAMTIEAWLTNSTTPDNVHLFSFSNGGWTGGGNYLRFNLHDQSNGRNFVEFTGGNPAFIATPGLGGRNLHIVFIYDATNNIEAIYTNGILEASQTGIALTNLSKLTDTVGAIGRSPWYNSGDNDLNGAIDEFRIYSGDLSPRQIALDAASGPNQIITDPGPLQAIHLSLSSQMPVKGSVQIYSLAPGGTVQSLANLLAAGTQQASLTGDFTNLTGVNLFGYGQPTLTSGNTSVLTVSSSGLVTAVGAGTTTITATFGGLSATQTVAAVIATNIFIFDSFGDGFWSVTNQGNGLALTVNSGGASQEIPTNGATDQQFEMLFNLQNNMFRIRQQSSWLCLGSLNGGTSVGTAVATVANYSGAVSQQWNLVDAGGGYFRIANSATNLVLQTDNGNPASVTLAQSNSSPYQLWKFVYQAHFLKKGTAGYEGSSAQLQTSWAYNYDDSTGASEPSSFNYVPMIDTEYWESVSDLQSKDAGWLSSPQPAYLLGYNEPDNTGSASTDPSTNTAIATWPSLMALNIPLVCPATQNTLDSWETSFFQMIGANNYRVDYSAVHEYVPPNAASLIADCKSLYNAYGRPVWLTEFSPVDWGGTAGWTEDDDYDFLAEFMWQAEDQDWFKRYSIFPFSGSNPNPPYTSVTAGYRGNMFLADGVTLAPYGELYATWDADRTLHARMPYIIHNLGTSFRLTSSNSVSAPTASTIYVRNATTEWGLLAAPTSNHWYVISLSDGRRLRDTGGTLDLAPPATTGSVVEWIFNGPDSSGYYYINNLAGGHNLNGSGIAPAISFSLVSSSTQNNATRWRFIKPYQPVSIAPAMIPAILSVTNGDQSVTLGWSGGNNFYNLYRANNTGGSYTLVAAMLTNTACADSTVTNGVPYYYVVTGLNILGEESGYSAEVSAMPTSANPTNIMFSVQGGNVLQLSWPADHIGWILQVQTNSLTAGIGTNWVTISGSDSTNQMLIPISPSEGSIFFRLMFP
jgi:hypothetical protein